MTKKLKDELMWTEAVLYQNLLKKHKLIAIKKSLLRPCVGKWS